uniref:Dual specificity protein kinase TTK n=1 Tax=Lates calcarifer TaxID=8187 RepID=A0A4W6E699_LATCA
MEEEEHTDRKQQLAMLYQKLSKIKKYLNDDDTDNINQVIGSNSPESCLSYLMDLEKKGDPHSNHNHLTRLIDFYTRVFSNMPLGRHCQNESYARMLVRFAELKAIQDVNEAEANFNVARSHSQNFAFVHIAHAKFEHSQGNTKRGIYILQNAIELGAKPKDLLEAALQSMQTGKTQLLCPDDKENVPRGECDISYDQLPGWRTGSQRKRAVGMVRVTFPPALVITNDCTCIKVCKVCSHLLLYSQGEFLWYPSPSQKRMMTMMATSMGSPLREVMHQFQPVCQGNFISQHLFTDGFYLIISGMPYVTALFDQVIKMNSPESCWTYLINLEKRGNPHTDISLLNKLKDCYSKIFSRLPIRQYSKNAFYARILVRYAELKGIEDPDEAQDHFIVARSNCKGFAFVHIAHAQFEVSQGNVIKATSILHKAQALNARPAELLEVAIRNLKAGEKQLVPPQEEEQPTGRDSLKMEQPKPVNKEPLSEWKIPTLVNRHVSPESHLLHLSPLSFITPVVKRGPEVSSSAVAAHRAGPVQQPCTPLNQVACFQTPQASFTALSNESITIKGKQFFILKMIGRGGSSKVYQVLDHKKQLFAVKFVDLEEADAQTIESYKNEIEHLNHLQQYSDQIIKLYDYEMTNSYIYMLMECGNLDLNTWLRNRKTVNPLERKFYWKNMLEAVHTIHKHGIVHSDLKPANFVIVNASLKLIDFGIANRIQPDVTSIMKDSQVGTLNYMPPEAIKDTSSQPGKARSKISPKGDVWSLGCILYCMTYGKTPFQSITNQITKLHAIIDPSHKIEFPDISEKDLLDVLKRCLVRNPRERISIAELLEHPYLQLKPQASPEPEGPCNSDLQRILTDLAALQSPNSIIRAANNLAKMCSSGRKLDVAECAKSST